MRLPILRVELNLVHFLLNIAISQRILNYILYLKNKNEDSFVKQSFLMSLGLHYAGKNSFHSNQGHQTASFGKYLFGGG